MLLVPEWHGHPNPPRGRLVVFLWGIVFGVVLTTVLVWALGRAALADGPPPESPGCQTYGCRFERDRRVVVFWPGHYQSDRRPMWDQVAYCESTWRWDYEGRHQGGLQFAPSTWAAYGGGEFAERAGQALPEQQIAVAERVAFYGHVRADGGKVEPQGPGAWPHCGRSLVAP